MTISSLVLTRPIGSNTSSDGDTPSVINIGAVRTGVINGQVMPIFSDPSRGNKDLSIAEQIITYSRTRVNNLEWLRVGNITDADSGMIMDFDGTVCYVTGHCEDVATAEKEVHLFINNIDQGIIGIFTSGANSTFVDTSLNFDFDRGDKLRLFVTDVEGSNAVPMQDTIVKITVKWRDT